MVMIASLNNANFAWRNQGWGSASRRRSDSRLAVLSTLWQDR
jgi:hypothetical protein